ncbi:MAG: hypothetical protein LC105_10835 [Chitinophagales bacterium]|nr:hypothetical protein [Chitinophagales bacterium]MCZ2394345.1 hypothetical protein [Chitinophagales bacterium]
MCEIIIVDTIIVVGDIYFIKINFYGRRSKIIIQYLTADVKIQVDGQKEYLQEYGEKIKGRITQIVDVDKARANVLAEAENFVDDDKIRIEKVFQFINEQVNLGEKKAKK